jgi:hydroxymethylbilane synthase
MVQAERVKARLRLLDPEREIAIEIIRTSGDVKTDPLSVIGGKGVFTKELEDALLDRRIDLAVHSLKDLPTIIPDGLLLAAICEREDPRDVLVLPEKMNRACRSLSDLPGGATVGTSSPRRLSQLAHLRQDLVIKDLRGNVDTRLRKLDEGQYNALILAAAGLKRLGLESRISLAISPEQMLPAVGQGAIGLQTRSDDRVTNEFIQRLDHRATHAACAAERALLRALGGGCQLPIAAHATVSGEALSIDGLVASRDGNQIIRQQVKGATDNAEGLGSRLAELLLAGGAMELLSE